MIILFMGLTVICGCTENIGSIGTVENAMETGNASECEEIQVESIRGLCYTSAAVTSMNESICEKITMESQKAPCYLGVATAKNDPEICTRIEEEEERDLCYNITTVLKG